VCMTGLVSVSVIFPKTKRSLRRWRMREFPMSSYFVEMLILIGGIEGKSLSIGKATTTSPWCLEGLTRTQKRMLQ